MARPVPSLELLQGTLDALVLKVLALQPQHGWGIAQRIQQISDEQLRVQQGSLYPALVRLEEKGWIAGEWGTSDNNRRARYYKLTAAVPKARVRIAVSAKVRSRKRPRSP